MSEEVLPRKGTIGTYGVPVALLLKFRCLILERNGSDGWKEIHNEFERLDQNTDVRIRLRFGAVPIL